MSFQNEFKYCSQCGCKVTKDLKFCPSCGNKLTSEDDVFNMGNDEVIKFIQQNSYYYINKFQEMERIGKTTSWNWASFLAGPMWFLYRKMYAYGFGIIGVTLVLEIIFSSIGGLCDIVIWILCGIYGNMAYLNFIKDKFKSFENVHNDVRKTMIVSQGGVNVAVPIIAGILIVLGLLY